MSTQESPKRPLKDKLKSAWNDSGCFQITSAMSIEILLLTLSLPIILDNCTAKVSLSDCEKDGLLETAKANTYQEYFPSIEEAYQAAPDSGKYNIVVSPEKFKQDVDDAFQVAVKLGEQKLSEDSKAISEYYETYTPVAEKVGGMTSIAFALMALGALIANERKISNKNPEQDKVGGPPLEKLENT